MDKGKSDRHCKALSHQYDICPFKSSSQELCDTVLVEKDILPEGEDDGNGVTGSIVNPIDVQPWEVELHAKLERQRLEFEYMKRELELDPFD